MQWTGRLTGLVLVALLVLTGVPVSAADGFVTMGLVPSVTENDRVAIRGTAPAGELVSLSVNGELQLQMNADQISVYRMTAMLAPGRNKIEVQLDGTALTAAKTVFMTTESFDDIKTHWAREDIEVLATLAVVNGVGEGRFDPEATLTRAQFAKLLVLALGLEVDADGELAFADADAIPDWARGFVATGAAQKLMGGYPDGTFRPGAQVTRAEMSAMVSRALLQTDVTLEGEAPALADADDVPVWVQADVQHVLRAGLVRWPEAEYFRANQPATRADAAAMIRGFIELQYR